MRLHLAIIMIMAAVATHAQTAAQLFVNMPDRLFPALTAVNRADMIDFIDNGMRAVVSNAMDSTAEMTAKTDDYIAVKTSAMGSMQMKVLPLNDSTSVICLVRTVCPGACMSSVRFFDTGWHLLPCGQYFTMPRTSEFLLRSDPAFMTDSVGHSSLADIELYRIDLAPDTPTMTITSTICDYATREEAVTLRRWLKPDGVKMQWQNGRFAIVK